MTHEEEAARVPDQPRAQARPAMIRTVANVVAAVHVLGAIGALALFACGIGDAADLSRVLGGLVR